MTIGFEKAAIFPVVVFSFMIANTYLYEMNMKLAVIKMME